MIVTMMGDEKGTGYLFLKVRRCVVKSPWCREFHEDSRADTPTTSLTVAMDNDRSAPFK